MYIKQTHTHHTLTPIYLDQKQKAVDLHFSHFSHLFFHSISHRIFNESASTRLHIHQMALLFTSRYFPFFLSSSYFPFHLVNWIGIPFFLHLYPIFPSREYFYLFVHSRNSSLPIAYQTKRNVMNGGKKIGKTTSSWLKIRSINIDRIELLLFAQCYDVFTCFILSCWFSIWKDYVPHLFINWINRIKINKSTAMFFLCRPELCSDSR